MYRNQICKTDVRKMDGKKKVNPVAARTAWTAWISSGLVTALLVAFLNAAVTAAHFGMLQQGIAEEVLRFHVLANSDSEEDQAVKYLVRDAVLSWISEEKDECSMDERSLDECSLDERLLDEYLPEKYLPANNTNTLTAVNHHSETESSETESGLAAAPDSRESVLQFLADNTGQIEETANKVLEEQGMPYRAEAEITWSYFPDRTYGECTFPAGWYQALRIRLGEAKGQNWWCLLYPSLCFTDALHAVVEEESQKKLEESLTAEEYQSLLKHPEEWKIAFRWFR
ncbi:MAG: stage II sporulation protein R [Lachnospiraceae bacterium]|nr:stage II sporulation protein R [Lachnospiraceae bacterium]